MSGNQQPNKDRSSNFCKEETTKLMLLINDFPVITNKKTDHASNQQKEAAWRLLTEKFNSDAIKYRCTKQLQQKYNNMKKTARKEMAAEKYGRRQTGGGPAPPPPSAATEWLNSIMGESISGLPAVYDSDALEITLDVVPDNLVTTGNDNLDTSSVPTKSFIEVHSDINLSESEEIVKKNVPHNIGVHTTSFVEDYKDVDISESEEMLKKNVPNNIEPSKLNAFDSSTPKSMLRKPVSKELSFKEQKRKTAFTPLETRKRIIMHSDRKLDYLAKKQLRETEICQYAKEEHQQNMRHKQELHEQEINFKQKMYELILEKCKYETEKAKFDLNKASSS